MRLEKKLLMVGFLSTMWTSVSSSSSGCGGRGDGQTQEGGNCQGTDMDECKEYKDVCGKHSECFNTNGSYYCRCLSGFKNTAGKENFTHVEGQCIDFNECIEYNNTCGHMATCQNKIGSYECICKSGYVSVQNSSKYCEDIDECTEAGICGEKDTCENTNGSYWCKCATGYTNYGHERTQCSQLSCEGFSADSRPTQLLGGLADILSMMRTSCLTLSNSSASGEKQADGEALLEKLLTATDLLLSPGPVDSSEGVSGLLGTMENSILLVGPLLTRNSTKIETTETDAEIAVQRGKTRPTGAIRLTNEHASLSTDWATAAGTGLYPGYAMAALLSYKNLEGSVNRSFGELEQEKPGKSFQVFSKVVSVVVSNPSTQDLSHPVNIAFRHLQDIKESPELSYICAYWKEKGAWSTDGCSQQKSNATHTVCVCKHLSSFAVLMALYPMEEPDFGLLVVTRVGLITSIICLVVSILTFKFCRSIQGTRTTIHLHLCICLFMADLIFLAGITQTKPEGGCKFVAGLLHFFFLAVITWMLLEGVQLYRMVVLVFNATIRPLYLFVFGYGMPLGIVVISAIIRPEGYGTPHHCWLSLDNGLIWSFFGPVCCIVILNVFFFIITVWKLAQKFASLNPDLSKLHKIKAFTVTAVAQMCILGLMWVFGAFLFQADMPVVEYIFTILNSLQGALVFVMHCLLSKQVREEYANFASCICTPQKKRYSDFSTTNPSSSQSQGSRSGQHTGESQI